MGPGITRRIFDGGPQLDAALLDILEFQDLEIQDLEILNQPPGPAPGAGADRSIFPASTLMSPRAGTDQLVENSFFQDFKKS